VLCIIASLVELWFESVSSDTPGLTRFFTIIIFLFGIGIGLAYENTKNVVPYDGIDRGIVFAKERQPGYWVTGSRWGPVWNQPQYILHIHNGDIKAAINVSKFQFEATPDNAYIVVPHPENSPYERPDSNPK